MDKDVVDFESYRRRKERGMRKDPPAGFRRSLGGMPREVVRILHFMCDAPDDPPLVKLAWLLSHFGEVPLPGGRIYRLERGRLEEKNGDGWERSDASFDDLAGTVTRMTREQWQWIASRCQPKKRVYTLDEWIKDLRLDDPSNS
jgi:hypothetical protein